MYLYYFLPYGWDLGLNMQPALITAILTLHETSLLDYLLNASLSLFPVIASQALRTFFWTMVYLWLVPVTWVKSYFLLSAGQDSWILLAHELAEADNKTQHTGSGIWTIKNFDLNFQRFMNNRIRQLTTQTHYTLSILWIKLKSIIG